MNTWKKRNEYCNKASLPSIVVSITYFLYEIIVSVTQFLYENICIYLFCIKAALYQREYIAFVLLGLAYDIKSLHATQQTNTQGLHSTSETQQHKQSFEEMDKGNEQTFLEISWAYKVPTPWNTTQPLKRTAFYNLQQNSSNWRPFYSKKPVPKGQI